MSNRKQLLTLLAIVFIMVFAWGCKKTSNTTNSTNADIYLTGVISKGGGYYYPAYWNNGIITQLSPTSHGSGQSIYVSGNDVYIGGYIETSKYYPVIWKDSNLIFSSDTAGMIDQIKVVNGSVYAVGYLEDSVSSIIKPVYWKDGVPNYLSTNGGRGLSIFIDNNDVYVSGYLSNSVNYYSPVIWKNGTIIYNDNNVKGMLYSVFVSGNNVYSAGVDEVQNMVQKPIIVTNGVKNFLTNNYGVANNVIVDGNDVYVTGTIKDTVNNINIAQVWKNAAHYQYPNTTNQSDALSSIMFNNELYTLGLNYLAGQTVIWKNGSTNYIYSNFRATSIFIK